MSCNFMSQQDCKKRLHSVTARRFSGPQLCVARKSHLSLLAYRCNHTIFKRFSVVQLHVTAVSVLGALMVL